MVSQSILLYRTYSVDILEDKGMIHSRAGQRTQNGMQFVTYELFIPGIFHLTYSDCGSLRVTETRERETTNKEALLYTYPLSQQLHF